MMYKNQLNNLNKQMKMLILYLDYMFQQNNMYNLTDLLMIDKFQLDKEYN